MPVIDIDSEEKWKATIIKFKALQIYKILALLKWR